MHEVVAVIGKEPAESVQIQRYPHAFPRQHQHRVLQATVEETRTQSIETGGGAPIRSSTHNRTAWTCIGARFDHRGRVVALAFNKKRSCNVDACCSPGPFRIVLLGQSPTDIAHNRLGIEVG